MKHSDRIYGQLQDICSGIRDSRIANDPEGITGNCTPAGGTTIGTAQTGHGTGLQTQVGGTHYVSCGMQPAEYAMANSFNYWQCLALRYMTRYKAKNGKQDLDKAIDCLQKLREHEYGSDAESRP